MHSISQNEALEFNYANKNFKSRKKSEQGSHQRLPEVKKLHLEVKFLS